MELVHSRLAPLGLFIGLMFFAAGCGKPPMQSVEGTVKLDGKPIGNCKIGFFPDVEVFDTDKHGFGFGITDQNGKFTIQHPQGDLGIWAGNYKVTFVAWVNSAGEPLAVDTKPSEVEGGVINLFPDIYEAPSSTTERVTVLKNSGKNVFDFDIPSKSSAPTE